MTLKPVNTWKDGDFVPRNLLYAVKEDGTLVIARNSPNYGHIDLAKGENVLAAGQGKSAYGKTTLDNASGHYLPQGEAAQQAAIKAFENAGFKTPSYIEKVYDFKLKGWVKKQ